MQIFTDPFQRMLIQWLLLTLVAGQTLAGPAEEAVDRAEDRRYEAMIAQDLPALAELLADELIYHQPTGRVATKEDVLGEIRGGKLRFHQARRSEVKIQVYGDLATVTGLTDLDVELNGTHKQLGVRYLNLWVWRDGRWQLARRQSAWLPE